MGSFDSLATLVNDLANATLSVLKTIFTGANATTVLTAFLIIALVSILMKLPQKLFGRYFRRE